MNLKTYARLKKKVESLRRQRDEAKGALEQLLKELQKDFGCKTIKQAKRLLAKKRRSQKTLTKSFRSELAKFKKKHGDL